MADLTIPYLYLRLLNQALDKTTDPDERAGMAKAMHNLIGNRPRPQAKQAQVRGIDMDAFGRLIREALHQRLDQP